MDIVPIYKRVIGLDVHQAQITGCAITANWARAVGPDIVVMESTGIYWKPVCGAGGCWHHRLGGQRPSRQGCARSKD